MALKTPSTTTELPDEKIPCWIIWQLAEDGGRPYLVAIVTQESIAARYVRCVKEKARLDGKLYRTHVEPSFLNHLYGESMGQGFDELLQMFRARRDLTGG